MMENSTLEQTTSVPPETQTSVPLTELSDFVLYRAHDAPPPPSGVCIISPAGRMLVLTVHAQLHPSLILSSSRLERMSKPRTVD